MEECAIRPRSVIIPWSMVSTLPSDGTHLQAFATQPCFHLAETEQHRKKVPRREIKNCINCCSRLEREYASKSRSVLKRTFFFISSGFCNSEPVMSAASAALLLPASCIAMRILAYIFQVARITRDQIGAGTVCYSTAVLSTAQTF